MPFTLAHPAAILPLHRWFKKVSGIGSALALGSISPDLPYFFTFLPSAELTHSLFGILIACFPMGLCLWLLWQLLIRPSLADSLPTFLARRCCQLSQIAAPKPNLHFLVELSLALCIGALTHVVWDSFTHRTGYVVQHFPQMEAQIFAMNGYTLTLHRLLQHASSAIGLFCLTLYAANLYRLTPASPYYKPRYPWAMLASATASIVIGTMTARQTFGQTLVEKSLFILLTTSMGC